MISWGYSRKKTGKVGGKGGRAGGRGEGGGGWGHGISNSIEKIKYGNYWGQLKISGISKRAIKKKSCEISMGTGYFFGNSNG